MRKISLLILFTVLLSGCSSIPKQVTLTPNVSIEQYQYDAKLRVALKTVDHRINHYLISITDGDKEAAQLVVSGRNIRQQLQQALSDGFYQQKLNQVAVSPVNIKVTLLRCHADINQQSFSYQGNSSVQIKVTVTTPQGDLAKLFKSEQVIDEAFSADYAKLQRNLNEQLNRTIERILTDTEIRNMIENSMDASASVG